MVPLIGYANRFAVAPGDPIEFKISSDLNSTYHAHFVRVVSGDPNPDGPGIKEEALEAEFEGDYRSRFQPTYPGSYARIVHSDALEPSGGFTVAATIWPTTPAKGRQAIVSKWNGDAATGWSLEIGADGASMRLGGGRAVDVGKSLRERAWYRIWGSWDPENRTLSVGQQPLWPVFQIDDTGNTETVLQFEPRLSSKTDLLIAASGNHPVFHHYNGKVERPLVVGKALSAKQVAALDQPSKHEALIAAWDFSQGIDTQRIQDTGPNALHGELVNVPTRAMTGSNWSSQELCWRHSPQTYGAIHFHDDDLHDCNWETDFSFTVPADFKSGVYAVRLSSGDHHEMIPFFVRAPAGAPQSPVCVLVPTFTYIVYANYARANTGEQYWERVRAWGATPHNPDQHPEYGISTYNRHSDGSGVSFSSRLRPILTMRSGFFSFVDDRGSGARHFPADTHLLSWLEAMGRRYDVVTDEDLHADGVDAIAGYKTVLTGSHPEYHTTQALDALKAYTDSGGRLAYLGGNGFYWKVAVNQSLEGVVEVRRGESGMRAWAAEPGEYFNALDGSYGGLWRRNARPAHLLVGNGFSGEGPYWGKGYTRQPDSRDPRVSWIFEGIEENVIGDFGLGGGGAAGFELDRADRRLGTPEHALILASAVGYPEGFMLTLEEWLSEDATVPGMPPEEALRSDMVYFETPEGGAVFSVGSITFCGSLPYNNFDNNISKLLDNVLTRFCQ